MATEQQNIVLQDLFTRRGGTVFESFKRGVALLLPEGWGVGETVKDTWTELVKEADYSCDIRYKERPIFELVLKLIFSYEYDGTRDGWNVTLETITPDGCIGPGYTPYNYTSKVWTKEPEEIERRLVGFLGLVEEYTNELSRDFIPHQDLDDEVIYEEEE